MFCLREFSLTNENMREYYLDVEHVDMTKQECEIFYMRSKHKHIYVKKSIFEFENVEYYRMAGRQNVK